MGGRKRCKLGIYIYDTAANYLADFFLLKDKTLNKESNRSANPSTLKSGRTYYWPQGIPTQRMAILIYSSKSAFLKFCHRTN